MTLGTATGVIQQFLHPPLGLMTTELVPGEPFSGSFSLTRQRGPIGVDAFGIEWLILSSPPGYGITPGAAGNLFDRVVIQIGVIHQLLDGTLETSQGVRSADAGSFFLFNEAFPRNLAVELAPGITARFRWLLVL